jgi:RND family efflux transporter MFP subunit
MAIIAATLAGAVAIGVGPRLEQRDARARATEVATGPRRVRVAPVRAGDPETTVTLPASSTPMRSAVLYSRSTGFVRENLVDIGDRVTNGQLLARVDAPETNEEIRLAKARLAEARANVGLYESTSGRMSALARGGAASQQEADDALTQANSASAAVATRRADLQRLEVLRDYQQIVAPFAGLVTRRLVDPGALVGPASAGGVAMFEIADVDTVRIIVDVPDSYAADVGLGVKAEVYSPRDPAKHVEGTVTRTSGVLAQDTRTLRVEIHVPGGEVVLPGAFVYARLKLPRASPPPVIPASALIVRKEGTLVAKVVDGVVTLAPVVLGRDFGKEIEIVAGIAAGDSVVVQPSDTLADGETVEVVPVTS